MYKKKILTIIIFCSILLLGSNKLVLANIDSQQSDESTSVEVEGWLTVVWGDPIPGSTQDAVTRYYLEDENGARLELHFEADSGVLGKIRDLQGQEVRVLGQQFSSEAQQGFIVDQIDPVSMSVPNTTNVSGSQPWISIMCKFSDVSTEPENLAFFQGMYADTYPGLNHYWQEQSYGLIDLYGSGASGWYVLPHPESYYNPTDTLGGTDLGKLADDCIGVADASVNFTPYAGINMMFNTNFDNGYAWGGYSYFSLDGVYKRWRLTWEPPWGYRNISVIAHETGHGFGLPHSTYYYDGNSDGYDDNAYDNYWDVMSYTWGNNLSDPTYGNIGQHTISYHKDDLGWISPGEKFIPAQDSRTTITLERLAQPQTANYKMAQISIDGSSTHFYTVEARRLVGYDAALPGNAVIIHEVNTNWDQPAHVIDSDGNGDTSDAGAKWVEGETFTDSSNNISVSVDSATSSGYVVTIQLGNPEPKPGDFDKTNPTNGASTQPTNLTLIWESSPDASNYEYCYDTTNDNTCSNWIAAGSATNAQLNGLAEGTTYYWQARAGNASGSTYANGSATAFWSFTTLLNPPHAFEKISPANGANGQLTTLMLTWESSPNAVSYEYCMDTTNDNACSSWVSAQANTWAFVPNLQENITYYWQVRAVNGAGTTYADVSQDNFWSITTTETELVFLPLIHR